MGDRGNIVLRYSPPEEQPQEIFLYTHSRGSDIGGVLQAALAKKWRWNDEIYLARIIFDELIGRDQGEETGYGLSPFVGDNEHDYLVVDFAAQKVLQQDPESRKTKKSWTFEEFAALKKPVKV